MPPDIAEIVTVRDPLGPYPATLQRSTEHSVSPPGARNTVTEWDLTRHENISAPTSITSS
jgi:hypothetical protein